MLVFPIGCSTLINPTKYNANPYGTKVVAVYKLGAFKPVKNDYGFKHYDEKKTRLFLAGITLKHQVGEIIEVDGLKWKKEGEYWTPYPNPPTPVLEEGEDIGKHVKEYGKWINDHPHFGYPPLPMNFDE